MKYEIIIPFSCFFPLLYHRTELSADDWYNGRAVIIGERTAGTGHNMGTFPLEKGFTFGLPVGKFCDPKTGKGWHETNGVLPDFKVEADKAPEKALSVIRNGQ